MIPGNALSQLLAMPARTRPDFAERRGPRRSRRTLLLRVGVGATVLLVLAGAVWWALTAPVFAVVRIESGAYRFTSETELQDVFSHYLGHNIWTLQTGAVAEHVGALPWIRDLRVGRRLPNTLEVDFREWAPLLKVAALAIDGVQHDRLMLLPDGRLLDFPEDLPLPGLPVLVGVTPVREGQTGVLWVAPEQAVPLLELVSTMEDAGLEAACPVDFIVARPEGFAIVLQNKQGTLRMGREEFGPRLQRYMTARDHLQPGLEYDMRFKDRITVRDPH